MDVTTWSTVHGFGVQFSKTKTASLGDKVTKPLDVEPGKILARSRYAYVIEYTDFLAPRTLYALLKSGVVTKVAFKPFTIDTPEGRKNFDRGSIVIPVQYQQLSDNNLYKAIEAAVAETGLTVYSSETGAHIEGIDLGSDNIIKIGTPSVATFVGDGINWTEIGEIWYLLGNRYNIPLTKINVNSLSRGVNLSRYTSIILADGSYNSLSQQFIDDLKAWVRAGGTLIAIKGAARWALEQNIVENYNNDKPERGDRPERGERAERGKADNFQRLDYATQREHIGPQRIGGALFKADLDITNPLAFGFTDRQFYAVKTGNYILPRPSNNYGVVLQLDKNPLISGFVTKENQKKLANAPHITFGNAGRGTVVLFNESPTFRGYWLSTSRILTNAVFFGNKISVYGRFRP